MSSGPNPSRIDEVLAFAASGEVKATGNTGLISEFDYFERGLAHYKAGDFEAAKKVWLEGGKAEPDHWNLRKQLWAIENPDKFYDGPVDYGWQAEQRAAEK